MCAVRTKCSCGITHDSKAEAAYCQELQVRVKAGDILDALSYPQPVTLVPKRNGCKAKAVTWKLDFKVWECVKGPQPMPPQFRKTLEYYVDTKGCLYAKRSKLKGYAMTQLKIRLWQLMGIPWELRIVYDDRVDVYNEGGVA